jgi:hypothetical protein
MRSFYEYWIGKGINYDTLWKNYDGGQGYIDKFNSMKVHLLRLTFQDFPSHLPLFNHEAISKTVKGTFHDIKKDYLSKAEYESAGPIFLYKIDRGSAEWSFLAELKPLLFYATALVSATIYAYQKMTDKSLENAEKNLSILKNYFPDASPMDSHTLLKAWTPLGRHKAISKLFEQRLSKIELSKFPFSGDLKQLEAEMVNMENVLKKN